MKKLVLIGNGGHAKVIRDIVSLSEEYQLAGYLDGKINEYFVKDNIFFDSLNNIHKYRNNYYFCIAIGNNYVREKIYLNSDIPINQYATLIHPSAIISSSVKIGFGTVVMANVVINADATIGDHAIINTGAIVEHDNILSNYVHISPNATLTGGVIVGKSVHIGAKAVVNPLKEVGDNSIVGSGATVVTNVEACTTVIGTPAKPKE
ncbi:acetyltransferase [Staphylococcus agnetis]|uniref:acetyltransferase n=1 Tax=Staphylococcus agnetis TaxID=985762 RepID=UPI000CD11787|nr:acetyltransferase [Staphylococcus agnetis]MBY7663304.1 acetyltransferase [Staphylococcus agnetis]NJH67010.1 acetyltransferase [Staphylococcus agnetis]NJH79411.1 acetyltransferase [Staphylococcus agnetis]PNY86732.1 acetyltransferase [Staphylococcus agnetis]PTH65005.1 acetyltransferase [Staphylococcus agnetis]